MKTNKILLLGLVMAFSFALQAQINEPATVPAAQESLESEVQQRPDIRHKDKRQALRNEIITKLSLTPTQVEQFDVINQRYREQMKEVRDNNSDDREALGQEMKALRQQQQEEVKTILTPEQLTIFEQEIAARKANRAKRGTRRGKG